MSYESPLKYFRDQNKEPDTYKKGQPNWHDPELELEDNFETENEVASIDKKETNEKSLGTVTEKEYLGATAEKFRQTIEIIKNATIKPEFKDDKEEQKIIENRKEMILKYLGFILSDARKYLTQVNYLQLQQVASYDSAEQYQSTIRESDGLRRTYHNKLISDLKIAIRLINVNFNADFPNNLRTEEEAKIADRKTLTPEKLEEQMTKRDYYHFPFSTGIFIDFDKAPKDPQGEREYIASWALNIYADLTSLENEAQK